MPLSPLNCLTFTVRFRTYVAPLICGTIPLGEGVSGIALDARGEEHQ